jgi:hypothetical protein
MRLPLFNSRRSKDLKFQSLFERNAEHLICLICLSVFLYLFFLKINSNQNNLFDHRWSTADWLISYADGFVRRGLFGELASYLQQNFAINPTVFIFKLRTGIYLLICLGLMLIAIHQRMGVFELLLILSPWALMFELNDPIAGGRKEILLILILIFFAIFNKCIESSQPSRSFLVDPVFYFLLISLPVLTLSHEGLFFFFQYFLLYQLIICNKSNRRYLSFVLPYLVSLLLLGLTYHFKGTPAQSQAICDRAIAWGQTVNFCDGSIASIGGYEFQIMQQYVRTLIVYLILIFGPIFFYIYSSFNKDRRLKVMILSACSILPVCVLFFLAQDWGRWLHISALLLFIVIFATRPQKTEIHQRICSPIVFFFILINPIIYITQWKIPTAASQFYEWASFSNDLHTWLYALNLWWW